MPRGDGTGPMGMGPMTGRGAGYCAGFAAPGLANPAAGWGAGFGRGRGFRRMYYMTGLPGWARYGYPAEHTGGYEPIVNEAEALKNQANWLEGKLRQVRDRLKELDDKS